MRLLGLIRTLTIKPINRSGTVTDPVGRRIYKHDVWGDPIEIKAQIDFSADRDRVLGNAGAEVGSVTVALVKRSDCERLGYTPTAGDLVVRMTSPNGNEKQVHLFVENPVPFIEFRGGDFKAYVLTLASRAPGRKVYE